MLNCRVFWGINKDFLSLYGNYNRIWYVGFMGYYKRIPIGIVVACCRSRMLARKYLDTRRKHTEMESRKEQQKRRGWAKKNRDNWYKILDNSEVGSVQYRSEFLNRISLEKRPERGRKFRRLL